MEPNEKKAVPPYVAYKTLINFLDRFKQGLPGRVDRGLMGSMSGAAQSQVITALRYLGMISEHGTPTPLMRAYVTGQETERSEAIQKMLTASYPFIFNSGFDFTTATASQLREAFETGTGASGETVARCIAFLKDAALDAGIEVSRFITQKKPRTVGSKRKSAAVRKDESRGTVRAKEEHHQSVVSKHPSIAAQESLLLWELFQRLPKPGTMWPLEERKRWLETLGNVLQLEYREGQGV